ncbi:hypothetical protein DDZ13_13050 [Coraliomargarita sinensis]|uniref:DUF3592 domain-containing protein n=1 Tax=Coraliomargarita sinensis TaxID=2174842 RepID=A0A317ZDG0_9BACT|nr:hypothetical protein [Coraliomargarita sinensis]PXA03344.1 hypothetical protein DDZ13_13050 [Coraliomargarita sinensis]
MLTDQQVEAIYTSGGHPKAWKVLKIVFGTIWTLFPIAVAIVLLTEEKEAAIRLTTVLSVFAAVLAPPTALFLYMLSPPSEKKRIRKLNSFATGTVTQHFDMYGVKSFNYTFEDNGKEYKGLDSCKSLPPIGSSVRIGFVQGKPKSSRFIPSKEWIEPDGTGQPM